MALDTLRSRLFLSYVAVAGLVLLLLALALLLLSLAPATAGLRLVPTLQRLRAISTGVERELRLLPAATAGPARQQALVSLLDETAAAYDGVRVLLLDPRQVVVYDSQDGGWEGTRLPELQRLPRLMPDLRPGAFAARVRGAEGRSWLVYGQPLPAAPGDRLQLVLAAADGGGVAFFRAAFLPLLWRAGLAALLVSLLLALLVSRSLARPLQRLAAATEAVARGEYEQRLPPEGPRELRRVAGSFNRMAAQVQATQAAQRDFLVNVSHDLKTPLTSIQGWSQALQDGTAAGPEEQAQAAHIIHEETERMARMVRDLLLMARIDSDQLQLRRTAVDLPLLLEDVCRNLAQEAAQKQIQLELSAEPVPPLPGDPDRLMQLFGNLVDNALGHTPAGGRVQLTLAATEEAVVVTVADDGPGIPAEALPRIFERFYQVEKSRAQGQERRGVGLGLAISRELARAHGGEISVESRPGEGTRLYVRLPLRPPPGERTV